MVRGLAERLAERLAADGHEVTYLTLRQRPRATDPGIPGVDVKIVGPRMELYTGPTSAREPGESERVTLNLPAGDWDPSFPSSASRPRPCAAPD